LILVTAGDAKIDNGKFRRNSVESTDAFREEARILPGHAVGDLSVRLKAEAAVYLDVSLKRFETVFPACGSSISHRADCDELERYSGASMGGCLQGMGRISFCGAKIKDTKQPCKKCTAVFLIRCDYWYTFEGRGGRW
jgi:hypothetical protein